MADVRPFRALRYDAAAIDPALTIAPPYDVISPAQQAELYERSPHNVVRIEYGAERPDDGERDNRYTRAAADLATWRRDGVLRLDDRPAIYAYRQRFTHDGREYARQAWFAAVRLEPWDAGIIKPHEHTLSNPKADRMSLLRATATQISPVYSLFRLRDGAPRFDPPAGAPLVACAADGQSHELSAITDEKAIASFAAALADADVYIADGHHRYETALAYRDEARARSGSWTGERRIAWCTSSRRAAPCCASRAPSASMRWRQARSVCPMRCVALPMQAATPRRSSPAGSRATACNC
jgi:uncharacterized protein (DUF1015 family)